MSRLVAHPFNEKMWSALFGGGCRKTIVVPKAENNPTAVPREISDMSRQMNKFQLKLKMIGPGKKDKPKEVKPSYKEKFVPPEVSIINYFMTKPYIPPCGEVLVDYDSEASIHSSEDEEDYDSDEDVLKAPAKSSTAASEHLDPTSYSWCLMRYAIIKYILHNIQLFLPSVGIELPELPVCSPLLQSILKTLERWEEILHSKLDLFSGPPDNYIPCCYIDTEATGPIINRYKTMLESNNTPFVTSHHTARPAKRLWQFLIHQEYLQDVFIRYIFKKKKVKTDTDSDSYDMTESPEQKEEPVKIIHKDQDAITAFCVNQANLNCVVLSTPKELIEMDVGAILSPPEWLDDETEFDIEGIVNPMPPVRDPEDFLVVSCPQDKYLMPSSAVTTPSAPGVVPAPNQGFAQSGRGGTVMAKRPVTGIRRMGAHPCLPYYLTGSQDGSVRLWEWGHIQHITMPRQPGTHPKVSRILFNQQGNKFGVADTEGSVCLWQVGLGVNMSKPYMSLKCHNKTSHDFTFVGSSSLIASAGQSSDNKNICLWDTLVPQRNSLVQGFTCHDQGCLSILYAPQHHVLISGGKKGEICIFDIRQRQLLQTFQAHESAIRCMSLDPSEEFFVTGSAEGNVKIWGLSVHNLMAVFPNEHSKTTIFRNIGSGVMQVSLVPPHHLYSCGADGSLKVRRLPDKESIVNSLC